MIQRLPNWFTAYRNPISIILLVGILIVSLLVHVKLPVIDLGAYNLVIPAFAIAILLLYRDIWPAVWQVHRWTLILTLLLYVWMWISAGLSDYSAIAIKFTIKYSSYFFTFPALLVLAFQYRRDRQLKILYFIILFFLLILAGFGILDYFAPEFPLFPWIRNGIPFGGRIASLLQNPNQLGVLMAFGVVLACTLYQQKILPGYSLFLTIPPLMITLVLSGSRNGLFVFLISLLLILYPYNFFSKKTLIFLIPIVILACLGLWQVAPRFAATVQQIPQNIEITQQAIAGNEEALNNLPKRLGILRVAAQTFTENPITGTGIQTLATQIMPHKGLNAHNLFLTVLAELGIPGLLLLLGIFISALWQTHLLDPKVGLLCSFIITAQIFDFFIHDFPTIIIMSLILAIAANLKTYEFE